MMFKISLTISFKTTCVSSAFASELSFKRKHQQTKLNWLWWILLNLWWLIQRAELESNTCFLRLPRQIVRWRWYVTPFLEKSYLLHTCHSVVEIFIGLAAILGRTGMEPGSPATETPAAYIRSETASQSVHWLLEHERDTTCHFGN